MWKQTLFFVAVMFFLGCSPSVKTHEVTITKTANNTIKFSGLDLTMIQSLGSDSASSSAWQSLIPVYKMPADTDLKTYQPVQPGKYAVQDSIVIFTPDTPLQKGQTYFVRYYHFAQGSSLWQHIKAHRKMSSEPYTDLILKQ
ncbi:MAG: hypothetical protein ACTHNW_16635 [Mucilaginibacter sp.]